MDEHDDTPAEVHPLVESYRRLASATSSAVVAMRRLSDAESRLLLGLEGGSPSD